ncbi:MAG: AAA family ATPase, partial [Gammaproteobacteria bacterium]|nr:AAA family ATPase [Gammaproteobacteria bacterium]
MRLTKIKLAGFKSFVDPTSIPLPSNLIGVVGPNGCGKSNVIDAVRWVMGESSAKHLRGDSMADVIFNGSSARKPVGQATVEMLFDNSDGTIKGEFADYNEISIRRTVSRDGQSQYFLNGTRCRRRDVTGIFLGTGLGPRSYSIIEQGMISRLIEARPEDLRNFLEEAAGISKYKERRRETENRIRHTRENLDRLSDLRDELGKQIDRLQRQSRSAEKYKEFKQEERLLKGQLTALRWKGMDGQAGEREKQIREKEAAYEEQVARQRAIEAEIEKLRDQNVEATETFNEVQGRYYSVGGDIARIEQSIQHANERRSEQEEELKNAERSWIESETHLASDRSKIEELTQSLTELQP